jgi:CHAT domain-containing protein
VRGEEHLSGDEIDVLVSLRNSDRDEARSEFIQRCRGHLSICASCRELLSLHEAVQTEVETLRSQGAGERKSDCPESSEVVKLATDQIVGERKEELMKHITSCDHCGPWFRETVWMMTEPVTSEEQALLNGLESTTPAWQNDMARHLGSRDVSRVSSHPFWTPFRVPGFAWGLLAAGLVLGLGITVAWLGLRKAQNADQLLAQAYAEQRTLELRWPGARYSPVRVKREPGQSNLAKSPALLDAEALIARKLAERPADAAWLQAKGRAEILDWAYDSAISTLNEARELEPASTATKLDLASAYFERAESSGRPIDYGTAIELLGQVLASHPDNQDALFNRAIIFEKMFMYHEALKDWDEYLRADPSGEWSNEARQRAEELRKKISDQEATRGPLLDAREFHYRNPVGDKRDTESEIDLRIEEYLDKAIIKWLPVAYDKGLRNAESENALRALSTLLYERHGDDWLKDVLSTKTGSDTRSGFRNLSKALEANIAGNPEKALGFARQAESAFGHSANHAALLRATTEELYSLHRLFRGPECAALASRLRNALESLHYQWMKAQIALEEYACWAPQAQLDHREALVTRALELSERSGFRALHLRAVAFAAGLDTDDGNVTRSWLENRDGLEEYWHGSYPALRAYQFYDDLISGIEHRREFYLMLSLEREAVEAISRSPNRSGEAMARFRLARVASQVGPIEEARKNYEESGRLFAALPQDKATKSFEADSIVGLADIEAKAGFLDRAEKRLKDVTADVEGLDAFDTRLSFYRSFSEIQLSRGDYAGAEQFCVKAVSIAEKGLASLGTDDERRSWVYSSGPCYRVLVSAALRRNDKEGALGLWEWYLSAPTRSSRRKSFRSNQGVESVQFSRGILSGLDKVTVLSFAELPDGVTAWLFDDRGIFETRLDATAAQIRLAARTFLARCGDPRTDPRELRKEGRFLFDWLVAPMANHLSKDRTVVIEGDVAPTIPFETLVDTNGKYLIESFSFSYSVDGVFADSRPAVVFTGKEKALIVGNPLVFEKGPKRAQPLPDALSEARYLESSFAEPTVLTGSEATAEALLKAIPEAVVFHFAGHADTSGSKPGLLLAPTQVPGREKVSFFAPSDLAPTVLRKCRLVVLSACATARDTEPGEGTSENLARAFFENGVPQVVASRWEVDSSTTTIFMQHFYKALLLSHKVAEALQAAEHEVMVTPATSHPSYWAAFGVYGRN